MGLVLKTPYGDALRQTQTLFESGTIAGLTDRELLDRFERRDGEAAESAFAAIVARHGPLVLRTCRAVLGDEHEAHDAFQAAFLILVRKSGSVRIDESLSPWLLGVARRVSLCARAASARRWRHERKAASRKERAIEAADPDDLAAVLLEEIDRLPERFRSAIVTCDLEGLTQEQAAARLGWPLGTIRSRLARGRDRLRGRLTRRGLAPSIAPFVLPPLADAVVEATVQLVVRGHVPLTIRLLTQAGLHAMRIIRWRKIAGIVVALGITATGVGLIARYSVGQSPKPAQAEARPSPKPDQPFTSGGDQVIIKGSADGTKFWGYSPTTHMWQTYKPAPGIKAAMPWNVAPGAKVTPLHLSGEEIKEVAVFFAKTGEWSRQTLKTPAKKGCPPWASGNMAIYRAGRYLYAFSAFTGTWAVRELGEGDEPLGGFITDTGGYLQSKVYNTMAFIRVGRFVCGFSATRGAWDVLEVKDEKVVRDPNKDNRPFGVVPDVGAFLIQSDRFFVLQGEHLYTFNPDTARFEDVETSANPAPPAK